VAVRGVAMTVSRGRFPLSRPAQIWVTPATGETLRRIGLTHEGIEMQLRLHDPDEAEAFATAHEDIEARGATSTLFLETWRQRRADSHSDIDILAGTLFAAGILVGLLTVATAAVIVAGRLAAQTRQIGTAGLRPSLARLAAADSTSAPPGEALSAGAVDHLYEQVRTIVLGTAGLLLVLATINALIIAALAARDSARNHATLRAVGATPRQTTATLVVSQTGACLLAVALGLPLGLGLWSVMDGGDLPPVPVPATTLLAIAAVVPLGFAALVTLPALRWAHQPPARALTYE
jgi:putative ABC transport system permease protein